MRSSIGRQIGIPLKLAGIGVLLGGAGSSVVASLVAAYVPRLDAVSWPAVGANAAVLFVVALLAAWVPTRHAAGIDPIVALRE